MRSDNDIGELFGLQTRKMVSFPIMVATAAGSPLADARKLLVELKRANRLAGRVEKGKQTCKQEQSEKGK